MSVKATKTLWIRPGSSGAVTGNDNTGKNNNTPGTQVIKQTTRPWPKCKLYNSYHYHPATGWDKATKTYISSRAKRSFMVFPPEIRNIIYHALLIMPSAISVQSGRVASAIIPGVKQGWHSLGIEWIIHQTDVTGLSLTCKTIYRETVPLYYSQNTFQFTDSINLKKFTDNLGPEPRRYVTKLSIVWTGVALARAAQTLGTFTGLRKLELDIKSLYTFKKSTDPNVQLKIYGLRDLLRIRGLDILEVQFCSLVQSVDTSTQCTKEQEDAFMRSLEVLKQPRAVTFN